MASVIPSGVTIISEMLVNGIQGMAEPKGANSILVSFRGPRLSEAVTAAEHLNIDTGEALEQLLLVIQGSYPEHAFPGKSGCEALIVITSLVKCSVKACLFQKTSCDVLCRND